LLCLLVLAAVNLRATIAVVPPLAETIAADLGLSAAATGLLTTSLSNPGTSGLVTTL